MMKLKDLCQVKDLMATVVQVEASLRQETGLNLNQAFALCCLNKGALTAGALAEELRIHGASLSRIIKALAQKGYINREIDSGDSRQRVVSLTEEGAQVAAALVLCENRLFPVSVDEMGLAER